MWEDVGPEELSATGVYWFREHRFILFLLYFYALDLANTEVRKRGLKISPDTNPRSRSLPQRLSGVVGRVQARHRGILML